MSVTHPSRLNIIKKTSENTRSFSFLRNCLALTIAGVLSISSPSYAEEETTTDNEQTLIETIRKRLISVKDEIPKHLFQMSYFDNDPNHENQDTSSKQRDNERMQYIGTQVAEALKQHIDMTCPSIALLRQRFSNVTKIYIANDNNVTLGITTDEEIEGSKWEIQFPIDLQMEDYLTLKTIYKGETYIQVGGIISGKTNIHLGIDNIIPNGSIGYMYRSNDDENNPTHLVVFNYSF